MARFLRELYLDDKAAKRVRRVRRTIERGSMLPDLYVISLSDVRGNQLEVLNTRFLLYPYNRRRLSVVVGAAYGRESALELIRQMAEETFARTGGADIAAYLKKKEMGGT